MPTIASRRNSLIMASFSAGFIPATAVAMPACARTACAVSSQSPVRIVVFTPRPASAAIAGAVSPRIASESWHAAAISPSSSTQSTLLPERRQPAMRDEPRVSSGGPSTGGEGGGEGIGAVAGVTVGSMAASGASWGMGAGVGVGAR